jgi:hypothetical protein
MERRALRLVARLVLAVIGTAAIAVAFLWGDYLLGLDCGIAYAATTGGLLWLFVRALVQTEKPSLAQAVFAAALAFPIAFVMARPVAVFPDLQHFIADQATCRAARKELAAVFESDPAYVRLAVSTATGGKVASVTIRGRLNDRSDLDRVRSRIIGECPALHDCYLRWDVALREPAQRMEGYDHELFHERGEP